MIDGGNIKREIIFHAGKYDEMRVSKIQQHQNLKVKTKGGIKQLCNYHSLTRYEVS